MEIQPVIILITINARPEKRKELRQTLQSIVEQVRKEGGCLHAAAYQSIENENDLLVVEEWETQRHSDDHLKSDIFTIIIGARSLMCRPPKIVTHMVRCCGSIKP